MGAGYSVTPVSSDIATAPKIWSTVVNFVEHVLVLQFKYKSIQVKSPTIAVESTLAPEY